MANVANLIASAVEAPSGLWITILNWIESSVVNYGWVIILFTLLIKTCLTPLDFVVRYSSKKQTLAQQKLAPQIERINKKYANDKNQLQLQTNQLYKKEGINPFVSCIVMIVNLVVTMVVFFTLFDSLRVMSAYKAINQYDAMQTAYVQSYNDKKAQATESFLNTIKETNKNKIYVLADGSVATETVSDYTSLEKYANYFYALEPLTEEAQKAELQNLQAYFDVRYIDENATISVKDQLVSCSKVATDAGLAAANQTWQQVQDSWLWIGNIWVADSYKNPLPTYQDLQSIANSSKEEAYINYVNGINTDLYNVVTTSVGAQNDRWNGYFILAVLAAVTSFLSQWLSELSTKSKSKRINEMVEKNNGGGSAMKIMKIALPLMMVIFVVTSSAAFGLYIVSSSLVSIGLSQIINLIVNACTKKKQAEVDAFIERENIKLMKKNKKA